MATFVKFHQFVKDLVDGVHDFDAHTFKVALSNTAPTASTDDTFSDITEISAGNGYTAGGTETTIATSVASGVAKVTATDVTFTASGGAMATFRYVIVYNDTPTSPADPLIGYVDYGSAVTLSAGETFTVDFDASNGLFTLT